MDSRNSDKRKSKTGLAVIIILAVAVMLISIALVIKLQADDLWFNFEDSDVNNPIQAGFFASPVEAQTLYPFGNGILKASKSRIAVLDIDGNEIFGEAVSMEAPLCYINEGKAVIIDSKSVVYVTVDTNRNIKSSNASGTLDFGFIGHDGHLVLLTDEPGVKGVAQLLNYSRQALFTWKSAQSGYILSASLTPDSRYVDFSIANTDGAQIQPVLRRFSLEGEAIAQFIPDSNELLPIILYDTDKSPVMIGQTTMIAFGDSREKYNLKFNRIYTANESDSGILVAAREKANDIPGLFLISTSGNYKKIITLSEEVTPIAVKGNYAAIGFGNTVVCVSIDKGEEISRHSLSAAAIRVGFFENSNNIIVVARDGVTSFPIKTSR